MSEDGEAVNPWKTQLKRATPPPASPRSVAQSQPPETPMSPPAAVNKRLSTNMSAKGDTGRGSPAPVSPRTLPVKNASFATNKEQAPASPAQSPPMSRRTSIAMSAAGADAAPTTSPTFTAKDPAVQVVEPVLSRTSSKADIRSQGPTPEEPVPVEESASTVEGAPAEEPAPSPPVSLPERVAELEALLATRERELNASREQVNSLQRLQANSTMDAKVKVLNEERVKLATKLKEMDTKLHKEIDKLKKEVKNKDGTIADLKSRLSKEQAGGQQRKSMNENEMSKLVANAAVMDNQLKEANVRIQALQKALTEREAENMSLAKQLERAQDAIVNGANVGYDQEVKLHQARSALHAIMSEVACAASPGRDRASTPRAISTPASPTPQQDAQSQRSPAAHVHPPPYASPPRYAFNYSPRSKSPYMSPTHRTYQ